MRTLCHGLSKSCQLLDNSMMAGLDLPYSDRAINMVVKKSYSGNTTGREGELGLGGSNISLRERHEQHQTSR